jgi:hypothetical protein
VFDSGCGQLLRATLASAVTTSLQCLPRRTYASINASVCNCADQLHKAPSARLKDVATLPLIKNQSERPGRRCDNTSIARYTKVRLAGDCPCLNSRSSALTDHSCQKPASRKHKSPMVLHSGTCRRAYFKHVIVIIAVTPTLDVATPPCSGLGLRLGQQRECSGRGDSSRSSAGGGRSDAGGGRALDRRDSAFLRRRAARRCTCAGRCGWGGRGRQATGWARGWSGLDGSGGLAGHDDGGRPGGSGGRRSGRSRSRGDDGACGARSIW